MENKWILFFLLVFAVGQIIFASLDQATVSAGQTNNVVQLGSTQALPDTPPSTLATALSISWTSAKDLFDVLSWNYAALNEGMGSYLRILLSVFTVMVTYMVINFARGFIPFTS